MYEVLSEAKKNYAGDFSILEFGTSDGYAFTKILYAARYLGMSDRVIVHTFDSFEGMPMPVGQADRDLICNDDWVQGQFKGRYENLERYCRGQYRNYHIHKGYFQDTLTDEFLVSLRSQLPILIWLDCDYYSSCRTVFDRLIPYIPNGCTIYFDEYEFNYGSRFTGEARLVNEINRGMLCDDIELVLDRNLSLLSQRVYRFIRPNADFQYKLVAPTNWREQVHLRSNDSPLP